MKEVKSLNFNWLFKENCSSDFEKELQNEEGFTSVDIPHANKEIPYNYFNQEDLFRLSCYKKVIRVLPSMLKKEKWLVLEGIAHVSTFYIDNSFICQHEGGYDEFKIDLTNYLTELKEYTLTIFVDSHEKPNVPPFGNVVDYLGYGGIYRGVYLELTDKIKIEDCYAKCYAPLTNNDVTFEIKVNGGSELNIEIDGVSKDYEITNNDDVYTFTLANKILWSLDNPHQYEATLKLYDGYTIVDELKVKFGVREAVFKSDGFYLNGEKIKLVGLNRHQSYPYIGYSLPKRSQIEDARLLKYKLGVNIVRCSHYMQSTDFLNECDKIGLLVLEELPGWQYIGNKEFKELSYQNITSMIKRDKLHPSIVLWGVRINESGDDSEFYKNTNKLAHRLDDIRQTCGVRNFGNSEFLEDVYTFNDFSHSGGEVVLAKKKDITEPKNPYLVTECNGHMFPTKSFDNESRRLEHALRHLRVINASRMQDGVSGMISWCMNDYNTHKEFGSGDMICYHGVMDMFRNPKLASYAYSSQQDEYPVMMVSSNLSIGEYNACYFGSIYVFTNLDYVKIYKEMGEEKIFIGTFYPDNDEFKYLKHPPVIVTDFIGDRLINEQGFSKKDSDVAKVISAEITQNGSNISLKSKLAMAKILKKYNMTISDVTKMFYDYTMLWGGKSAKIIFEGYKDDKLTLTSVKEEVKEKHLDVEFTTSELTVDETYDVVKASIKCVDQNNNLLSYCNDIVNLSTTGPLEIIGPKHVALVGGMISFWCKTTTNYKREKYASSEKQEVSQVKGTIMIECNNQKIEKEIVINLEKDNEC